MTRRPRHSTPLAGACFVLGFTALLGVGGVVVSLRASEPPWAPMLFPLAGVAMAILLQWGDLAVLRALGHDRPERWRRRWRVAWVVAPLLGATAGAIAGALFELPS